MQHMQQPTCSNVRIRSTQDAHKIFLAVQRGALRMVTRRLDAEERQALGTGCVYAWEERGPHTEITGLGIERFTEGRRWSPSRVRDEFLFYYEKFTPPLDANQNSDSAEKQPPRDWDPLVKQTYSVWVETEKGRRKWHLTAYFTQATVDQLGTIDDFEGVGNLELPDGLFKSTRVGKNRNKSEEQPGRPGDSQKSSASTVRTYAPFPTSHYSSSQQSPSESPPVQMYDPYLHHSVQQSLQYPSHPPSGSAQFPLPPIRSAYQPNISQPTAGSATSHPEDTLQHSPSEADLSKIPQLAPFNSTIPYQQLPIHSNHNPQQNHVTSLYPSATNSPQATSGQSPPVWYPSYSDRQANLLTSGTDGLTSYTRASYSNRPSALTAQTVPASFYSHPYPYPDSNSSPTTYSETPSKTHSRSRSPQHANSRSPPSMHGSDPHLTVLPPLAIPEHPYRTYEIISPADSAHSESRRGDIGPCRDLAPLNALKRGHPYRRDPMDDKALRLLGPHSS